MMRRVFTFASAVVGHWGALVTGGVAIGLLSIWQGVGHSVKPGVYWSIAIAGLLIAFFRAWQDENDRGNELEKKLTDRVPLLTVAIHEALVLYESVTTHVFLDVEIANERPAAPTIVSSYALTMKVEEQDYYSGVPLSDLFMYSSGCVEHEIAESRSTTSYTNVTVLTDVASSIGTALPVCVNLPHRGWLHFRLEGVRWTYSGIPSGNSVYVPPNLDENGEILSRERWDEDMDYAPDLRMAKTVHLSIKVPGGNSASSSCNIDHSGHRIIVQNERPNYLAAG